MTTAVAPAPATAAAAAAPDPRFYHLSVAQYEQMIRQGVLSESDKVELIEGFLVRKMSKNGPHLTTSLKIDRAFLRAIPEGLFSATEWPIRLERSEPEPDVMIVRGSIDDYTGRRPTPAEVPLLVEVDDSSLPEDRARPVLFAEAGVQVY